LAQNALEQSRRIFDNDFVGVFVVWIATEFSCLKQI